MFQRVVIGTLAAVLAVGPVWEQPAQSADNCQVAIAEAQHQIESKNTQVTQLDVIDIREESEDVDYPEGYPTRIVFLISGSGVESVVNSSVFLKALSHTVIVGCEPVSKVDFFVAQTDWGITFGLMGENKIEQFKCLLAGATPFVPWGYTTYF